MSVFVYHDPKTVGLSAATLISARLIEDPSAVLGIDYHENLLPAYEALSAMTESGLLNWNEAKVYQLFEFLPDGSGEQRIANLLGKALFAKTDISEKQYAVPYSTLRAPEVTAELFENAILADGGLDAALIAVRRDGSLLLNRGVDCPVTTHIERDQNDGFLTAGLSALMQAKRLIVVGIGRDCADAVRGMLKGSLTDSPLSALKLHPNATFLLDEEAAEML